MPPKTLANMFTKIVTSKAAVDEATNSRQTAASTGIASNSSALTHTHVAGKIVPYTTGYSFPGKEGALDTVSLEHCKAACLADNNMAFDSNGLVEGRSYYAVPKADSYDPSPIQENANSYLENSHPGEDTMWSYRCAGVLWDGDNNATGKCQLMAAGALPILAKDEDPDATLAALTTYYDLDCQNFGTRKSALDGGARSHYCMCNQSTAIREQDDAGAVFYTGERCTVPESHLHSNNHHGTFVQTGAGEYVQSVESPIQSKWRSSFLSEHPPSGYLIGNGGISYPLTAHNQASNEAPVPPPRGTVNQASTSGQCGPPTLNNVKGACEYFSSQGTDCEKDGKRKACCDGCLPTHTADATEALGAATKTPSINSDPDDTTGTAEGPPPWCLTKDCISSKCKTSEDAAKTACTSEPASFQTAAAAYKKCIANGRAMIKQDGVDRNDVSTWSTAQQNSLNQLLSSSANATCVTHYGTSSSTNLGSWVNSGGIGSGYQHKSSTDTGAIGCESLFDTCNSLSEYNATLNCTLNSAQNCQANILCNSMSVQLIATATGNNNSFDISQTSTQNLNASANYTNEFSNRFANNTSQSLQSLVSQFSSQLAQTEAGISTPVGEVTAGQAPSQGAREFAQTAAAISNITENAVSNSISNSQITDVANQERIFATVGFVGDNNKLSIKQTAAQVVQTSEITQNQVNNSFSNTTSQVLTAKTTQGDEVKRALGMIMLVFFLLLAITGAIVAAVFVAKKMRKEGLHLLHKGKGATNKKAAVPAKPAKPAKPPAAGAGAAAPAGPTPSPPPPGKKTGLSKIFGML
jgi:hypothetical protein